MPHVAATVEDQLIQKAVKDECPWENLPKRLQATLGSKDEWHRRVVEYCLKKRLPWSTSFVRKVIKENEYYEDMMRYLRKNLALFPYHLADYVCRVMRISSFKYYCDMIFEVMKNEQPYDSIPNFSAADALILTGIGRNEFIDIMNKCRSKKIMWKLNKSIAKELLPTHPVDFAIDPWWGICLVNFTLEEFKKLSEEEMATIDKICKEEVNAYILFDSEIIKGLYRRGLVYFDVPVYPDDRFKVSRLEGFVSNREQLYEDPTEELLYAVFVVSNENSTVAELAATLQADLSQLQAAASFACRLGWAVKVIDPASILHDSSASGSHINLIDDEDGSRASVSSANMSTDGTNFSRDVSVMEHSLASPGHARVAFVVDANITSYLMMGSVSPGLKSHAVTLYEAGKLGHASIAELCKDLSTLEGARFEGELQEFANHAFSLRCVLECLTSGGIAIAEDISDHISLSSLKNSSNKRPALTNSSENLHDDSIPVEGIDEETSSSLPLQVENEKVLLDEERVSSPSSLGKKKYHVDILRCESLASLAPATLDRLFHRDYDVVVSMVPLPPSSVLPGPKGPIHFGPPSYSSMTPWMKLVLYSSVGNGPLTVVLMKGLCLRMLPVPLSGCEKALLWSWDGSTVGGLGGKFEGNLVKGSILLHCLNSLLKYSAVLVQPLSKKDLDENGMTVTMDVPFPLKNTDESTADIGKELGLGAKESSKLNSMLSDLANKIELWSIGHIRLLKLFKENESGNFSLSDDRYEWVPLSIEFGIPLFSPTLCKSICKRVVGSQLLQTDLSSRHRNAMQDLRKKLREICAAYQAMGPSARLLYQKEQPKTPRKQLMNYASGRWNPLSDPSSPIAGATSEQTRVKIANRHRFRTEVLSFDGNILRSYALNPVYEAASRPIEHEHSVNPVNSDPDDDTDSKEVVLPGVDLIFDGYELHPFDIGACLQARQPISLIADASSASASLENY